MKYFIDFEATQFSNRIIDIGIYREDGVVFASLINPERKLTKFITELTEITQEDVDAAPSCDEVMSDLFNFFQEDKDEEIIIYSYGTGDSIACITTMNKMAKTVIGKMVLSFMSTHIVDYGPVVKSTLGLHSNISLLKLAKALVDKDIEQNHRAADDAILLKRVADEIEREREHPLDAIELGLIKEDDIPKSIIKRVNLFENGVLKHSFSGVAETAQFFIDSNLVKVDCSTKRRKLKDKIRRKGEENKPYCGYNIVFDKILNGKITD